MITLAVDTSLASISVAVVDDDAVRSELFIHTGRNHTEVLLQAIERALASADIEKKEIDLLAVTIGPGSFTGLRVGVSTVKGLALVLRKPVIGVCTLDALARNIMPAGDRVLICPMVDAGRDEVYVALYRSYGQNAYEKTHQECVVRPDEFVGSIRGEVIFLGGGAQKYKTLIEKTLPNRSFIAHPRFHQVRAGAVGHVGTMLFHRGGRSDIMTLVPNYLRSSYATIPD